MLIKKFGNAKIDDILSFENKYKLKLPKDYTNFLLHFNGGQVAPEDEGEILIEYLNEFISVDVLYGIKTGKQLCDIDYWMEKYKNEMPNKTVIIGDSYQNGFIVMMCSDEDNGIYYWDDSYHFKNSNDEGNTYFLSNSFFDFAKKILQE